MLEVFLNYYEVRLYVTTSQRGSEGQGNKQTGVGTDIHSEYDRQAYLRE